VVVGFQTKIHQRWPRTGDGEWVAEGLGGELQDVRPVLRTRPLLQSASDSTTHVNVRKGRGFRGTQPNGRSCDWHFPNLRDPLCFRHADLSQGPNKRRDRWTTAVFLERNCTHLRRRTHIRNSFASRMYLIISFEEVQLAEKFYFIQPAGKKIC